MKIKQCVMAISLALVTAAAFAGDVDGIRKSLEEKMPGMGIGTITKTQYGGLYEVVVNGVDVFYTDASGKYGFFGNVVDLANHQSLTQQRVEEVRKVDFAKLPLDKAIVRVKGDGSRKMALFTDPDCPFCKELEKELEGVSNVTIYTFLYPLTELHPDAKHKAELVWCAPDRAKAWDEMMLQDKLPAAKPGKCDTPIAELAVLAKKLWITGTPGIIFGNGKLIPGGLSRKEIEDNLSVTPKPVANLEAPK